MRNHFVCFAIFGLWTSWNNKKHKLVLKVYSTVLLILIIIAFVFAKYSTEFNDLFKKVTLSTTVTYLLYLVLLLAHLVIAFESLYKSKMQENLIQAFSTVDQLLSVKTNNFISYSAEKRKILICNIVMIFVILFLKIPFIIYAQYKPHLKKFAYPYMYSTWILRLRLVQVIYFVILIRSRLILMNEELVKIQSEVNENYPHRSMRDVVSDSRRVHTKYSMQQKLMSLKEIYGTLHDACELVNDNFGWSLLAIFMQTFITFTANCYWVFFLDKELGIAIVTGVSFLIQNLFSLSILAFYCSSCFQCVRI